MTNANNYGKPKVGYEKKEKQREDAGLSDYVFGKVMPQALQLEEAVLGALMLDTEAFSIVSDILKPESFYADQHQLIYKAIVRLFESSNPVDLLTVTESLKKAGDLDAAGGGYYMVELTHRVASAANIEYHARILQQKSIQRQIISASTNAIRDAYEDTTDVFDLLDRSETALFKISQGKSVSSGTIIGSLAHQAVMFAEKATEMQGLTGVPSGLTSLDRFTGGFQDSDLIIVAARPGMGKTAAVLTFARNAAKEFGKPVAFFSLEMPETQLGQRLTAAEAGVNIQRLRTGKCDGSDMQALSRAAESLSGVELFIDDSAALSISELRAKARRFVEKNGVRMIIVDYLQLMSGSEGGNREQVISAICRGLKTLAKELKCPVIALSQLSRAVETRGGSKRPQLSDLRESGGIEQEADMVMFIYRPEYYQILEDESGKSTKCVAEFIIAKHRNGGLGTIEVGFTDHLAQFHDLGLPYPANPAETTDFTVPISARPSTTEDIPF